MGRLAHVLLTRSMLDGWARGAALQPTAAHAARTLRIAVLLSLLAVLNAFDLGYTLLAYHAGWLQEMNPIAARLLHLGLEPSLVCYKCLTVLIGTYLLWRLRHSPWASGACWLLVVVYVILSLLWVSWTHTIDQAMALHIPLDPPISGAP